jgi:hypothetical protein
MPKNPVADPDTFVFGQTSTTAGSHDGGIAWVSGRGGTRGSDTSDSFLSGPDDGADYNPMFALPAFDLA